MRARCLGAVSRAFVASLFLCLESNQILEALAPFDSFQFTLLILRAAIEGLLKLGILQGDKEDILKTRTSVAFFPHGLGHYLGMDTVRLVIVSTKLLT
jgi:Xaa-Pro dipeptidase